MTSPKTLRIHFPQWQGGDNEAYYFGSQLLQFLAPQPLGPVEEIPVQVPNGQVQQEQGGLKGRDELIKQLRHTQNVLEKHQPDNVVVLGGDCLVDLAPFAYLNEKYDGELAILWVDAHPDILTPEHYNHAHAMVLGNLMGFGDEEFKSYVTKPVKTDNVLYAGLGATLPFEEEFIEKNNLSFIGPDELNASSAPVVEWLKSRGIKKVAIHLDLDVMDIKDFGSLYFAEPNVPEDKFAGLTQGSMTLEAVQQLIIDVAAVTDVVGLGITEHLPWDAIRLRNMMAKFPLLGE